MKFFICDTATRRRKMPSRSTLAAEESGHVSIHDSPRAAVLRLNGWECKSMTARWSFQLIVVPLAVLMLICGAILLGLASFSRLPITSPLPFVESQETNRVALGVVAAAFLPIAVGLLLKQKWAWCLLLGVLAASVLVHLVGMWDSRIVGSYGMLGCILQAALSAIIGGFIYYGTRPAFSRN